MSSKPTPDERLRKKLKSFFDKNASPGKRWKSLTSYVEKASNEDINKFFNENFYMIYGVFFDSFTAYEATCKKGKHSNSDVTDLMLILRHVLIHLSELIRKKWQTRSIAAVLEKLLYKENKISVREPAFTLLLYFLEAVSELESPQVELFATAIDMGVFAVGANQSTTFRRVAVTAPDKTCVLVPSNNAGNPDNSVKLWENMLNYLTNKPAKFEFWMEHLKMQYFSIFYPEVSKRVGISSDDHGFQAFCPHPIQKVNMVHLVIWISQAKISSILWSSEQNIQLVLEMFRQACKLPISYAETIRVGVTAFMNLFIYKKYPLPKEFDERIVEFRKFFIQQLSSIFQIDNTENITEHINLCLEVVHQIKQIFLDQYESFALETQECLLNTLLETTINVGKNQSISGNILRTMLDTVFFIWIHTKRNTEKMWENLQRGIASTFSIGESIAQTRLKIIQLTLIIREKMYPRRPQKKKPFVHPDQDTAGPRKPLPKSVCPDTRKELLEDSPDPNITSIEWENLDELIYVWNQVLQVFGTVNSITEPQNHAAAIQVLCEVIELLQRAEEEIPHNRKEEMERPPLCLIDIFGHWLFESCYLPETYIQGTSLAIGALCRLVVRHSGDTLPLELLSHFYVIVTHCLKNSPNSIVSWSILQNSSNIFNLALPGCNVLIPHYMNEIKRVQKSQNIAKDVRLKNIIIACSLICYPNHLDSLSCPADFNSSDEYDFSTLLKKDVCTILIDYANGDTEPEHKVMSIWGMCTLICEELTHTPNLSMIKEIIRNLLPFCTHTDSQVCRAALDSLSTLTQFYTELSTLDETRIHIIIDILCSNIHRQLIESKASKTYVLNENLVADHFYCLSDWIMSSTTYLFNKAKVASKVFEAIELGLLGQRLQVDSNVPILENKKNKKRSSSQPQTIEAQLSELLESLIEKPSHGSDVIKSAAHVVLMQLCNFLQNFPCKEGIEIVSSQIDESDDMFHDQKPLFFIYNNFALFSLVEIPLPDGTTLARLILRDCTGKYAWDSKINYNNYVHEIPPPYSLLCEPVTPPTEKPPQIYSQSDRQPGVAPKVTNEAGPPVDQLDDLLQYLGEVFPDCLPESGAPLNQPSEIRSEYKSAVEQVESALLQQTEADQETIHALAENVPPYQDWSVVPPKPVDPQSPLHHCRLFLNHLGFLSYDKQASFTMVDYNVRFSRSLQQLDKYFGREMLKIGLIYVKEGQDDQKVLFRNQQKSDLYAEFVRAIGWPIDVFTHRGYLGGLDPKGTTGATAPYYATPTLEVIFHEITSIPTNSQDVQSIHKKRHVGNDIVHIIYSEHTSDYAPTTITSQFNDAHIIVYPLPNGLFRIQIYRKETVQLFGPLIHGMCVNKKLLVTLVRQTAINANRYVRYSTPGYSRPFPTRRKALDEIIERFSVARPYEDLVSELLDP